MVYLDYSSTSNKKPKKVVWAYKNTIKHLSVNSSRGAYPLSIKASIKILEARNSISKFFNLNKPENVIFTSGCTESINLALIGTAKSNGHIISTIFEHNSVLRTLNYLKKAYNISYTLVKPSNKDNRITNIDIMKAVKSNTYLVVTNHTSNVTGATSDIKSIGKYCKENNLIYCVDSAQSAGHIKINIQEDNINLLCIAGHKGLYSPQGIGALLINDVNIKPIKFGGTGTESENINQPSTSPEGFEAGTMNLPAIIALNEGVKFVNNNFDRINNKIAFLSKTLLSELEQIKDIEIYCHSPSSGVISIRPKNIPIDDLYDYLNSKNICTRNGLHCAPIIHKNLGTLSTGLIRISIGYYNKKHDIFKITRAIKKYLSTSN